ncbi:MULTISPECIES: DUF3307 domain-containing protein [unclassified Sporosarcina]|uniref:DUF3307 domain-containing protein n=1 Tax=unclassified Sporosarcina TaxID=2647733 RepID=UPI000C173969|nr:MULTISPECIES: DUF3307 domain-containing protein [unclassified Sporosarcina]PID05161.1 hypothetical protein CSV66_11410 [Sporosarcina sp. P30]PID08360.1 hypothetical protein CSV65_11390 [Sporosarcina sp. P31]PID11422.1 hypothetical protein CSV64_11855 [Sporosarcina sp. P32b]
MNLFTYLLLGHLVGDYLLQNYWMAMNKANKWIPLLTHCLVYTLSIFTAIVISGFEVSWLALAIIYISHAFLDKRFFVFWWVRTIMGVKNPEGNWLLIITDQIFHLLILGLIVHLLY